MSKRYPELNSNYCGLCSEYRASWQLPNCDWGICEDCRSRTIQEAEDCIILLQAQVAAGTASPACLWGAEHRRRDYLHARRVKP